MKPAELQDIADVCKMLSEPTRLSIVAILVGGAKPVMALCDALKLAQPTVSHHLALLRMSRLVNRKRKGKQMIYSLNKAQVTPLKKFLAQVK